MSDNLETFLSQLANTYNTPAAETSVREVVKASAERIRRAPSNNGNEAKGKPVGIPRLTIPVPEKGSLNHKEFLIALRRAKDRNESIQAIAGYVGYDPREEFGPQEYRAKAAAQLAMKGETKVSPDSGIRNVRNTVRGYVAGMPDLRAKRYADLMGRLNMAIDKAKEHRSLAGEALSDSERDFQSKMADVEEERIASIQKDITAEFG